MVFGFCRILRGRQIKKFKSKPNLNVGGGRFLAYMYAYNVFFVKF